MKRALQGRHLHFDPLAGIAGDMTVAALVDLGVPRQVVADAIAAMKVKGLRVRFERRKRGAFAGTGFVVRWPHDHEHDDGHDHDHDHDHEHDDGHDHDHDHDHDHHEHEHVHDDHAGHEHRDYAEIRRLLRKAALPGEVKDLAGEVFERIARVEAELHGTSIDRVAFHEVGAYDSIADVVGAAAAVAWLAPASITSTPPVLGTGSVRTAHGRVSVPAPATAALLEGVPVRIEGRGELTTPTGAALLSAIVDEYRDLPPVRLLGQGFGAGTRELADRANMLRVFLGEPVGAALPASPTEVTLLQANIDDMNPQLVEPLMTALFEAGALDAWVTPIVMKKGRPALEVSALAPPGASPAVARAFFLHSSTLGVREAALGRTVLARSAATVETAFGAVKVKVAALDGEPIGATPEFDDCRRLATRAGVPVREVLAEAAVAAARLRGRRGRR